MRRKIKEGDFVETVDDLGIVVKIVGNKLLIDNNVNKYPIDIEDVYEVY